MVAGWALAIALILLATAIVIRTVPAARQPVPAVGFAAVLVATAWLVESVAFAAWVTRVASYGSIYGGLGVVILTMTYVYLSVLAFLGALQADALIRRDGRPGRS